MALNFPDAPSGGQVFQGWIWDGTKWGQAGAALAGDITGVAAGTGLSGGGTSGDVTLGLAVPVTIANGGTGAITAGQALTNLAAAPLAAPAFTGAPTAPTAAPTTNTTQIATTAFVGAAVSAAAGSYLPIVGGTLSGVLNVSLNAGIPSLPGAQLHVLANNAANTIAAFDSFGTGFYPEIRLRAARGTGAAPTAVQSGDLLGLVSLNGRDSGGNYNLAAQMYAVATENWTPTNRGSAIQFNTNVLGTPGTTGNPLTLGAGVMVGVPLAYDPGAGNIIATGYFVDNTFALFKTGTDPVVQFDTGYQFQLSRATTYDFQYYGAGALNFWSRQSDGVFINSRGFVQGNGAYLNSSDRRLKEDIQPTGHGLETILKLEPVEFRRKPAPIDDRIELERPLEIGFIANDVAAILPEAIRVTGMDQAVYEASDSDPFLGLTSETITAVLVNAVKELSAQLKDLQAKVNA